MRFFNFILLGAVLFSNLTSSQAHAVLKTPVFETPVPELVIAEKRVKPGIVFIFEGAVKDSIHPRRLHLAENQTNVHLEARVNWDTKDIPKGAPAGGFVPYLKITAEVIRQKGKKCSGKRIFVDIVPHINLVDSFHYARNIALPGPISVKYCVIFNITPPAKIDLALHRDWIKIYNKKLLEPQRWIFKNINFEEIARATRK